MEMIHDPIRQINYLRQTLSQAKKPLGFFIAAGCPSSILLEGKPLIPDIKGLTECVRAEMIKKDSKYKTEFEDILKQLKEDGNEQPNIEEILTHTRSLKQVAGKGEVRGLRKKPLEELDLNICKIIADLTDKSLPNSNTPYHKIAAWISSVERSSSVEIFTINYDLLFEEALEANRVPYFDGFIGSKRTFFDLRAIEEDKLPSRWTRLWKLHGSINWLQDVNGDILRGKFEAGKHTYLIYPSHLKYDESRRMPYLAMIDRLKAFLKKTTSALFICGYSFNDDHINEVIVQGLQGNPTSTAFAMLYGKIENYPKALSIAANRANLVLIARDKGVIGTRVGTWKTRDVLYQEDILRNIVSLSEPEKANRTEEKTDNEDEMVRATNQERETSGDEIRDAQIEIGDFAVFGDFIQDLIGEEISLERE